MISGIQSISLFQPDFMSINFIGDIFLDIIAKDISRLPEWETDTLATISMQAGGSCLNSICHAKTFADYMYVHSQGNAPTMELRIFSSVGFDSQGTICSDHLQRAGLSTNGIVKISTERTGTCIVLSGSSDRCFVTDRGCIDSMSIELFDWKDLLNCQHFHFAGYYNCSQLRIGAVDLFRELRSCGITTSVNPQYDATGKWGQLQELCPYLTILFANADEVKAIAKESSETSATMKILGWGCEIVVVTSGSTGSTCYRISDGTLVTLHVNSFHLPQSQVVDSTGAGDAYVGGFIVSWVAEHNLEQAMKSGSLCGATAVCCFGGSATNIELMKSLDSMHSNA